MRDAWIDVVRVVIVLVFVRIVSALCHDSMPFEDSGAPSGSNGRVRQCPEEHRQPQSAEPDRRHNVEP